MRKTSRLDALLITSTSAWGLVWFVNGDLFGWMNNSFCFKYLGCNAGFFGYDALVHFLGGIMEAAFIFWLAKKSPKFNFFSQPRADPPLAEKNFWKNFIIVIALVALLGVGWELGEFAFDRARMDVLRQDLLYPTNRLRQASNSDTMGDFLFGLFGAAVMTAALGISDRKHLIVNEDDSGKEK